jgi:hypothetical protein
MEKQPGVTLSNVWDSINGSQKAKILKQIVELEKALA